MSRRIIFPAFMLLVTLFCSESHACSGGASTLEERFNWTPAIFYARITELEVSNDLGRIGGIRPLVVGRFELIEVLKGSPPIDRRIMEAPGSCAVRLKPGVYYIFFTSEESAISSFTAGSTAFTGYDDPEALQMLAKLRALAGH
ncbi:hypothetical protein [Ferrovibrio sp.]|uniref:hypothetical protein n=1 Tax=Ferrovibrio sp. TaxID=1917215 RepID=UPI003D0B5D84